MRDAAKALALASLLAGLAGCGGTSSTSQSATVCEPRCPAGTTCTAGGCVLDAPLDLAVSVDAGDPGACSPACSGATPYCGSGRQCVACLEDKHCPLGQVCKLSGAVSLCVQGCTDDSRCDGGKRCCGGGCVDTSTDVSNCGGCGTTCAAQNAASQCVAGQCAAGSCATGWGDCNADPRDGCETNLRIDADNCGTCKTKCALKNAVAGCGGGGCYIKACTFGNDNCDGKEENGCEAAVVSDIRNCGACGNSCPKPPHAANACINASCQITGCDAGWGDCDGQAANGCEVNISSDNGHCGKCGAACAQGLVCKNFGCTCPQCNFPHATSKCLNNVCLIDQCNNGWADCDGNPANGCEIDITTDKKNCNACGNACQQGLFCIAGACVMTACGDGVLQNNEEVDPPVSPFMSVQIDQVTCRWDFSMVAQLYCNGACSWTGGNGCDQANADIFCKLKTGNPNSTANKFTTGVAIDKPGFPCLLGGNYGKKVGMLQTRGVNQTVYYQDTSIVANHGQGQVILTVDCN